MVIRWLQQARDSLREIYKFYEAAAGKNIADKIRNEIYQETQFLLISLPWDKRKKTPDTDTS